MDIAAKMEKNGQAISSKKFREQTLQW